jgi:RimJ/RimL family protein N-acetyltransferase
MAAILQTERLTLRQWLLEDFEPLAAFLADPELSRYRTGRVDRHGAWTWLTSQIGQLRLRGYGPMAAEVRDSGVLIGFAGLYHPITFDEPELAYSLFRGHHGHGFATEMADGVRRWAASKLRLPPLMSFVHPDNTASRAVCERLGATIEGETEFLGQPRLIFRHTLPASFN